MSYQEFKNKYNEKYLDYDKSLGNQCWDLGQYYFTECLKLPESILAGCGLVSNMLKGEKRKLLNKYFDEVPTNAMLPGDVVIWEYGHIAIYDHWDGKYCYYFSQNPNPCRVITINRAGNHAFRLKGGKVKELQHVLNEQYGCGLAEDNSFGPLTENACNNNYLYKGKNAPIHVKWLQTRLIELGYSCGSWGNNGVFGEDTLRAVKLFQAQHGLDTDGLVGKKTHRELVK